MMALRFVWLEITGKCQLRCAHCYADSGPAASHGAMTLADWTRAIGDIADLGARTVQFIGGEPTLHPELPRLISHALARELKVEVFTNLFRVTGEMWNVFSQPGVRLATSYCSDHAAQHELITTRQRSHDRTKANIIEALRRSIPLRVGVIDLQDGQRVVQATDELRALGVREIGVDRLRQVGRGIRDQTPSVTQLCGGCGQGTIAIAPDGSVWPCVFSRWMPVGNVRTDELADILASDTMTSTAAKLAGHFNVADGKCAPKTDPPCDPQCGPNCGPACNPSCWPTGAGPCGPKGGCQPNYD